MRKTLWMASMAAMVAFVGSPAEAGMTKDGFACFSEQTLDAMLTATAQGDEGTQMEILRAGRCFPIRAGETITIVDWPGLFNEKVGFLYKGVKFWTLSRWVDLGNP